MADKPKSCSCSKLLLFAEYNLCLSLSLTQSVTHICLSHTQPTALVALTANAELPAKEGTKVAVPVSARAATELHVPVTQASASVQRDAANALNVVSAYNSMYVCVES